VSQILDERTASRLEKDRVILLRVSTSNAGGSWVDDENRTKITVAEAAEYLGLSRESVLELVNKGIIEADKFAGAIHIPREEVERIERETAP
jgi:excisionase family DNA binding protein